MQKEPMAAGHRRLSTAYQLILVALPVAEVALTVIYLRRTGQAPQPLRTGY